MPRIPRRPIQLPGRAATGAEPVTVLFVGDISWDTTVRLDRLPQRDEKTVVGELVDDAGGVVTNAASACAVAGVPTRLMVARGDDDFGELALNATAARGVQVQSWLKPPPNCRAIVLL